MSVKLVTVYFKVLLGKDVEWRIGSKFDYVAGEPRFDSHPGWHFLEALISLPSDYRLQIFFIVTFF